MSFDQIMIFMLGVPALWLVSKRESHIRKWGFLFGLGAQPFWYISVIESHQWGILLLNICYTFSWINGIYQHFIKK
jgi:hypothetical protein